MNHFVIFVVGICMVFGQDDIEEKCYNFRNVPLCCDIPRATEFVKNMDICRKTTPEVPCAFETCIADKQGLLAEGGKLDKDKLSAEIKENFKGNEDLEVILQNKCVNADWDKLGLSNECVVSKVVRCIQFQVVANCPNWIDSDECQKKKSELEECKSLIKT